MTPEALAAIAASTPGAKWREEGQPDPFGNRYDCPRDTLHMGDMTDDELANAVFLYGGEKPDRAMVLAGKAKMPIVYLTAAKDRIRWLSRREATLLAEVARLSDALTEAEKRVYDAAKEQAMQQVRYDCRACSGTGHADAETECEYCGRPMQSIAAMVRP